MASLGEALTFCHIGRVAANCSEALTSTALVQAQDQPRRLGRLIGQVK